MAKPKNIKVTEDTQIHMTTVYSRNGKGKSSNASRSFNFVIKGILISTALVGSVITAGGSAFASGGDTPQPTSSQQQQQATSYQSFAQEEVSLISNLKMVTKVLDVAIQRGELNPAMYQGVLDKLNALDTRINSDKGFDSIDELTPILNETDKVLKKTSDETDTAIQAKRSESLAALSKIQGQLGIYNYTDVASVEATQTVSAPEMGLLGASATKKVSIMNVYTYINGVKQTAAYTGVVKNKIPFVPITSVFKKLGAKVTYDSKTKVVTAVKGKTVMKVKIGNSSATVNGKAVSMGAKAEVINKVTMVPIKLVVSTFGGTAKLDANSNIAIKTAVASVSSVKSAPVVINGVKQTASYTGVVKNKVAYTPITSVFTKLGAKVTYDSKTKIITAIKGKTVMKVKLGNTSATVNGKSVALGGKAEVINKVTMAPIKLITATFGGTASVDSKGVINIKASTAVTKAPSTPTAVAGKQVVNGITVDYGKHTYASKNQTEYNKVMGVVNSVKANYSKVRFDNGGVREAYYQRYLDGERPEDFARGTEENRALAQVEGSFGDILKSGQSKETAIKAYKTALMALTLQASSNAKILTDGTPTSAYDLLFNKVTDCDADANLTSAVFDSMGFPTAILVKPGHATLVVKIGNSWFTGNSAKLESITLQEAASNGYKVGTAPTDGSVMK